VRHWFPGSKSRKRRRALSRVWIFLDTARVARAAAQNMPLASTAVFGFPESGRLFLAAILHFLRGLDPSVGIQTKE
jgi:hypothetical protein